HSFVFHRGRVGKNVRQLIADVRKVMEPYTARALKVRKNNSLKDFVAVAGPLGVTHFLVFSKSSSSINFVNLNSIKRCLLISYDAETQLLDFRHYSVKVVPVGMSKGLKKLLQEKFPNMSRLEDISELLVKDINLSESEAEQDGTHNVLELPQAYAGRGNMKAQQSAVRLTEIGPRMTLQLIKVEEGLAQGNVLYHSFVHKTEAEVKEILARKEAKLQLKAERRQKQEADVERKRRQREAHREKSLAGIRRKRQQDGDSDAEDPGAPEQQDAAEQSEESDAEYYRQEVGEEPDKGRDPAVALRLPPRRGGRERREASAEPEDGDSCLHPGSQARRKDGQRDTIPSPAWNHKASSVLARGGWGSPGLTASLRGWLPAALVAALCLFAACNLNRAPARSHQKEEGDAGRNPPEMAAHLHHCGNFSSFQESLWLVLAAQFPPALVGNGMAVYRFATQERSWHSGIVYSFHLAVSGMLYSLSLPFLAAYYYPPKDWRYGATLCKLERFLFNWNLYGGIFFVTCISLNRYLGIVHPLWVHGRLQPRHAKALSAIVWVLAGALSAPTFFFSELQQAEGAIDRREKRKGGTLVAAGVVLYAFSYLPYHVFRNLNLQRRLLRPGVEDCAVSRAIHTTAQVCKILVNLNICLQPLLYAALADSMQSCCGAACGAGTADGERAEHAELQPVA
ncbi:PREDICTED: uncharacterized protein LOC104018404, partial [Nipponia nippon]|uniref:uncharacterized protein LOC104018404 n=1 Tax=Nipponia nippon TaxID=128390 RepID=UPI0005109372